MTAGFGLGRAAAPFKKALGAVPLALLAGSLLTACLQEDPDPDPMGPDGTPAEVGKAEIALPAIPKGFLLKSAARGEAADPFFILTISGGGMVPRKHAWPLSSAGGTAVIVDNIPVGSRLFTGQIEAGGAIVYADSAWAVIEAGRTALVRLKLGRTTGNAKVCVEIEGLPPPTGCAPPDSLPDISGCWSILGFGGDSAHPPRMRILQRDSSLQAVVTWPANGWSDTAQGYITHTGFVHMDGDFVFSGSIMRGTGSLTGKYYRRLGGTTPTGIVTLVRGACEPVLPPPPVDSLDSLDCFDVAQILDGKAASGRYAVLQQGYALYGHFQWKGYPGMPVSGKWGWVGSIRAHYLYGNLPTGLARDPRMSDGVHYKAQVGATSLLEFGAIYGTDGVYVLRGDWKGVRAPCQAADREIIMSVYGI